MEAPRCARAGGFFYALRRASGGRITIPHAPGVAVPPELPPSQGTARMATPKTAAIQDPAWLAEARKYLGEREIKGPHHNPHILKWWKDLGEPYRDDETAWCGAFVGGVLRAVGLQTVKGAAGARNWTKLKVELDRPAYGCIVVFWRGDRDGWAGHVGFVVGVDRSGNLMVLGGNQGDMVSIKPFDKARVLGYYWPGIYPFEERFNLPLLKSDGKLSTNEA